MKTTELRKLPEHELKQALMEKRASLRELRFNAYPAKGKNVMTRKETRRDIARIMTLLKEVK